MIKPLNDYVLIEKLPSEKKIGSIVLASEKKTGNIATVVAIGPGVKNEEGKLIEITGFKAGDKVIFKEYAGTEYEEGDHKYILLKQADLLATVD